MELTKPHSIQPENQNRFWESCDQCKGRGKKSQRLRKKVKLRYQTALAQYKNGEGKKPLPPKAPLAPCQKCKGPGLLPATAPPLPDSETYPHLAIIGAGIGGGALAVACLHRGIPFTLYERDANFQARAQGYGLTLQQASKAIEGLGIFELEEGIVSTRHIVHTPDGKVIGEWGMRKWLEEDASPSAKRTNIHIARQALRLALLKQLGAKDIVQWHHQLVDFKETADGKVALQFQVDGQEKHATAHLLVGADGIRSAVRSILFKNDPPLRYLGCIVILGICTLESLEGLESELLDSATVFQTANGTERIYMMPYTANSLMWQLSFPIAEKEAKALSTQGPKALKAEACRRTQWHSPIPQILAATREAQISGYPVYDREVLTPKDFSNCNKTTLLGDAAHPMSPFKGQGANQALLDALALAREITIGCRTFSNWKEEGIRKTVLTNFEAEMLARTATKVKDSAAAADFLHSQTVLVEADRPRCKI